MLQMNSVKRKQTDSALSFMFPVTSGIMGGVQSLIINLISYLSKGDSRCRVRLYDYSFGLIKRKLDLMNIDNFEFISLDNSRWVIPNKGDEIFVLTNGVWLSYPFFLANGNNVRVMLWDVYYPYWKRIGKYKSLSIPRFKKYIIQLLCRNNGVIFTEKKGLDLFNENGCHLSSNRIVPIPINCSENLFLKNYTGINNVLRIGYIGRAEKWKIMPLKKLVEDLARIGANADIYIYTENKNRFMQYLPILPNINYTFISGLYGVQLEQSIMCNKIDMGYSMGTSALEFGRIGVPTILADFSSKEFPNNYQYRLLHFSSIGDLGMDVDDICDRDNNRMSLENIISKVGILDWSTRTFEHVRAYHSIENVTQKLLAALRDDNLLVKDINLLLATVSRLSYGYKRLSNKKHGYFGWGIR